MFLPVLMLDVGSVTGRVPVPRTVGPVSVTRVVTRVVTNVVTVPVSYPISPTLVPALVTIRSVVVIVPGK